MKHRVGQFTTLVSRAAAAASAPRPGIINQVLRTASANQCPVAQRAANAAAANFEAARKNVTAKCPPGTPYPTCTP